MHAMARNVVSHSLEPHPAGSATAMSTFDRHRVKAGPLCTACLFLQTLKDARETICELTLELVASPTRDMLAVAWPGFSCSVIGPALIPAWSYIHSA